ncbi:MAG: hypothetical protein AAF802_02455 [Planctomycetota bacterium]
MLIRIVRYSLVVLLVGCSIGWSENRRTDDLDSDLVRQLVAARNYDEAEWLCASGFRRFQSDPKRASKWAAHWSFSLAAREREKLFLGRVDQLIRRLDDGIRRSNEPVEAMQRSLPRDHGSTVFLAASSINQQAQLLRAAIVASAVSSSPEQVESELLRRVPKLQASAQDLIESASIYRNRASTNGRDNRSFDKSQFERLEQELSVIRVSLAVLQSELFAAGSKDAISSASDAAALAEQILLTLPRSTPAHGSVLMLLADAYLRSENLADAKRVIDTLANDDADAVSVAQLSALRTRYGIKADSIVVAQQVLDEYQQSTGRQVPDGTEMDFANLDLLLASRGRQPEITNYLNAIESKGGAFRRRRAEAIVLDQLDLDIKVDPETPKSISPEMIAAQGEQALRQGDRSRAAAFLWRAAEASKDSETAITVAARAAAVSVAMGEVGKTAKRLRDVARKHATATDAPAAMLQAAILLGKDAESTSAQERLDRIEDTLVEIIQTWPSSEAARTAYDWLQRMMEQAKRLEDSADLASEYLLLSSQADLVPEVADKHFRILKTMAVAEATERLRTLEETFLEVESENIDLRPSVTEVSSWLLDLSVANTRSADQIADSPFKQLLVFRIGSGETIEPNTVVGDDPEWVARVRWRLYRDAVTTASRQKSIGKVLSQLPDSNASEKATAVFFSDASRETSDSLIEAAVASDDRRFALKQAIEVLASVNQTFAFERAGEAAERLAQTFPIGSGGWYQAKIEACRQLVRAGRQLEARKRAQYVLLTRPPTDSVLRDVLSQFLD